MTTYTTQQVNEYAAKTFNPAVNRNSFLDFGGAVKIETAHGDLYDYFKEHVRQTAANLGHIHYQYYT